MINGDIPLSINFALSKALFGAAGVLFTNCDECYFCSAIITMEYQITDNVY